MQILSVDKFLLLVAKMCQFFFSFLPLNFGSKRNSNATKIVAVIRSFPTCI